MIARSFLRAVAVFLRYPWFLGPTLIVHLVLLGAMAFVIPPMPVLLFPIVAMMMFPYLLLTGLLVLSVELTALTLVVRLASDALSRRKPSFRAALRELAPRFIDIGAVAVLLTGIFAASVAVGWTAGMFLEPHPPLAFFPAFLTTCALSFVLPSVVVARRRALPGLREGLALAVSHPGATAAIGAGLLGCLVLLGVIRRGRFALIDPFLLPSVFVTYMTIVATAIHAGLRHAESDSGDARTPWTSRVGAAATCVGLFLAYGWILGSTSDERAAERTGSRFHDAIVHGDREAVESLAATDPHVRGPLQRTPLHLASENGQTSVVEELLGKGADVDARDELGNAPLHEAARQGHTAVATLLLQRGAKVDRPGANGWTPLHNATGTGLSPGGHPEMVQLLLKHGADVNAVDTWADTPLHAAAKFHSPDAARLLLAGGANANAKNKSGQTPLHVALEQALVLPNYDHAPRAPENRKANVEIVRALLDGGADPNLAHRDGSRPLDLAVRADRPVVAELLLEHGADPNGTTRGGWTPLGVAVEAGRLEAVRLLLARGADVNRGGYRTPLQMAKELKHQELIDLLVAHGGRE